MKEFLYKVILTGCKHPLKFIIISISLAGLHPHTLLAQDGQGFGEKIIIEPGNKVLVQRCFIELDDKKNTSCVAVGELQKVHYALDLSKGALIKIWKGDFLDATTMWTDRGEEQLAKPLGKKILTLENNMPFYEGGELQNEFKFKGYTQNDKGNPTFKYKINGHSVYDRIWSENSNTQKLNREISVESQGRDKNNLEFLLAHGSSIVRIKKNLFSIDDGLYQIQVNSKIKSQPVIKTTASGSDLMLGFMSLKNDYKLEYSIIW